MPVEDCPECFPNIVFVPLLCFDSKKQRLGYGGGYYDRLIKHYRQRYRTKFIGIGLDALFLDHDTIAATIEDEPLDYVVTESTVFT